MNLAPAEREALAPHLERTARDLADLIGRTEPDVLHMLMEVAEAFGRTYQRPRQIIHNGRKPR